MRRFISILLRILAIAVIVGFVLYRSKFEPIGVMAFTVQRGPITAEVMGTGTLNAHTKATVSPKIQGRLVDLRVDQNDTVTTGQLLARLDDSDLKEQVEIAKANLDLSSATLERVQAEDARAKAVITQAQLDYQRTSKLETTRLVAPSDVDKSRENLQVAQAEAARAVAAIGEAHQQIAAAEKTLRYQEAKLSDTMIYSPFSGLVTRRDRDTGDIVVPGSSIFQLISTREIWVSAWVDESAMSSVKPGQKARILFRSDPRTTYSGNVVRISREVDRETREFLVDVNADKLPQGWAIGQRAEVFVQTSTRSNVVLLPRRLVRWREARAGVFVEENGKAGWHDLKLGLAGENDVEVVEGLAAGDIVISVAEKDSQKLQPGRRVVHTR